MTDTNAAYEIEGRELIAESVGLRVQVLTLGRGQCVPWHWHSMITDTLFRLSGPMNVATREPDEVRWLGAGDRFAVPAGQPHYVSGKDGGPCRFAIVQGVGDYDYVALD